MNYLETSRSRHHVENRKRPLLIGCIAILLLVTSDPSQELKSGQLPAREVPKAAIVEIVLLKAPGIDDEGSRWEIAYEFRITNEAANEAAFFEARKQGKPEGRVGELIKDADVSKPLQSSENHKFVFEMPFSAEIQERLRNQPKEHVKGSPGTPTAEIEKLQREQAIKFQIFKFYSVINIYDARLNKNILIPVTQSWDFSNYPDARFGFKIEIKSDGAYNWKTNLPANSRSPVMEIRKP